MLCKKSVLKNFSKFTHEHKNQSSGGVLSKNVLKNFAKLTGKHLCRSLLFNKAASWKPETARSRHWRCSVKQGVLKNFAYFTGKNLCWSLFLINLQFWGVQFYLKRLLHRCFPVKFANFLRTIILKNICECLLIDFI